MSALRLLACSIAVALVLASATARAVLSVNEPWVRPGADGRSAEAFMKVRSSLGATLAGVDSFAARSVRIRAPGASHALPRLALPANETIEMKPGAMRLELDGLVRPLRHGEHVPITRWSSTPPMARGRTCTSTRKCGSARRPRTRRIRTRIISTASSAKRGDQRRAVRSRTGRAGAAP